MKHIVFEMTIDGIVDLVFVYNQNETQELLDRTRDFIALARYAKPNYELTMVGCDCDNPDSHKNKVGQKKS